MSWQEYIDDRLMDSDGEGDRLTAAAIIDHDATIWAQSSSFPEFKEEEIEAIMKEFAEAGSLGRSGLYLGGTKYMVIQGAAGAVIRGRKVSLEVQACCQVPTLLLRNLSGQLLKGNGGVTIKKTNQGLIIGLYDEPMTHGQCNMIVETMGDYLIQQGV